MRLDHGERRDFPRMTVECPMRLEPADGAPIDAACLDLSGGGMRFRLAETLVEGSEMTATLTPPPGGLSAPLTARITVLRCTPLSGKAFEVSARILEILS